MVRIHLVLGCTSGDALPYRLDQAVCAIAGQRYQSPRSKLPLHPTQVRRTLLNRDSSCPLNVSEPGTQFLLHYTLSDNSMRSVVLSMLLRPLLGQRFQLCHCGDVAFGDQAKLELAACHLISPIV